jgi:formylmethanofuran dehydrogenase subunit B
LNLLSVSAQGKAVALGRGLRALVDVRLGNQGRQAGFAFQQSGRVTATLGEVRQRADVILFWNADPGESHPRLLERFCAGAKKWIFLQSGKSGVGAAAKTDDGIQRRWLDWGPERRDRFLASLLVDGLQSPAEDTRPSSRDDWGDEEEQLRNDLEHARYLTVFYRSGDGTGPIDTEFQSLTRSVREMNGPRRAVLIPLRGDDNGQGAENALAAECGFGMAVDFASGFARSHWLELSASSALQRGEVDVAMVFVDHRTRWQELQHWSPQTKWLIWHTDQAHRWNGAAVSIPMSVLGIDQPGDATRNDDFLIPVDCLQGSARGNPDELLSQMLQELTPGQSKLR